MFHLLKYHLYANMFFTKGLSLVSLFTTDRFIEDKTTDYDVFIPLKSLSSLSKGQDTSALIDKDLCFLLLEKSM